MRRREPAYTDRVRWFLACAVVVVAAGAGGLFYLARSTASPRLEQPAARPRFTAAMTWKAGQRRAPSFSLRDERGRTVSLASVRGKPTIVTFMDPVCRNLCPIEARVLMAATRELPPSQRPTIVAVSVNPWADTKANFAADAVHWRLGSNWHWAVGTRAQLAPVWHRYQVAVLVATKKVRGITVRSIAHTEISFVLDARGDERAVYVYPFGAKDVAQTVRDVASG